MPELKMRLRKKKPTGRIQTKELAGRLFPVVGIGASPVGYETLTASKTCYEKLNIRNGQWNIRRLRTLLKEVSLEQSGILDFQVGHVFPGPCKILPNTRRMDTTGNRKEIILLAFRDVTEAATVRPNL